MTKITVYKTNAGDIKGFECKDHAGFARFGKDIVCAAVSALVINTINSIEQLTDDYFSGEQDEKNAVISFMLGDEYSSEAQLLLKSLVLGLQSIEDDNPRYISLTFKEV